jgi:two-component system NtrC family sensor kinase
LARLRTELAYDEIVADVGDLMRESKDGLARVKKIVQDLKDFSRVDNSGWEQVDLNQGLSSTLSLVRHQIPSQVEIVCELGALPEVDCVLSQLNQVFMNILVNAAQAIGACGTLTIRSGVDGETVWISIGDSGCGIAPHNLPRIFDAFFTTKPVGVGTGLGLSLSYSIVKRHGGRIDVSSELGVGTTFTIVLPIHRP